MSISKEQLKLDRKLCGPYSIEVLLDEDHKRKLEFIKNNEACKKLLVYISEVERLHEYLRKIYVENQNLNCCTAITPKIGWKALNEQTRLLCEILEKNINKK